MALFPLVPGDPVGDGLIMENCIASIADPAATRHAHLVHPNSIPMPWNAGNGRDHLNAGYLHQYMGSPGSGKTLMGLLTAKKAMEKHPDKFVIWISTADESPLIAAHRFCKSDKKCVVNMKEAHEVFDYIDAQLDLGICSLIVVDEITSLKVDAGVKSQAALARFMPKALHRLANRLKEVKIPVLLLASTTEPHLPYSHPNGRASSYLLRSRIMLRTDSEEAWELVDEDGEHLGRRITSEVVKNRDGPNGNIQQFWVDYVNDGTIYTEYELERKEFEDKPSPIKSPFTG